MLKIWAKSNSTVSGVLGSILEVQQLDVHDIEGVSVLYARLKQQTHAADGTCLPSTCSKAKAERLESCEVDHARAIAQLLALTPPEALRVIRDYLIAATAKDCSIMIACRLRSESDPSANELQSLYEYRVRVVDLDMKSTSKIESHMRLDAEILASYRAGLAAGSV